VGIGRIKAAKSIYLFATQIKSCSQDAELKRHKALKDAEELIQKEQERLARLRPLQSSKNDMQPSDQT
jgi:hypothetical protein